MTVAVAARRARGLLAVVVVVASTVSCDGGDDGDDERACGAADRGTVWIVAGSGSGALHRVSLCPLRAEPVAPTVPVFGVDTVGDRVLVASDPQAPAPAPPADDGQQPLVAAGADQSGQRLRRVDDGRLLPLTGMEDRFAQDPALGPENRVAFVANPRAVAGPAIDRLFVYDPATEQVTPWLASDRTLDRPAWGPDGQLAAYRGVVLPDEKPEIVIVSGPGQSRVLPVAAGLPVTGPILHLAWGRAGIALSFFVEKGQTLDTVTVVVDPATGEERQLPGVAGLAWSPDGRRLLTSDGGRLSVRTAPRLDQADKLGTLDVGTISDAAWAD